MQVALWLTGIVVALFAIDQLALWAERKGWIYWRKSKRQGSVMSAVLSELDAVTNPAAHHIVEAKQAKKLEERDNGDPPKR